MELLPAVLRTSLPALYSQEHNRDPTVHLKFFSPYTNWTWFVTEGGPQEGDFLFFGYVIGFEEEWGYFSLSELQDARSGDLPLVERDLYFTPGPFSEVIARFRTERGDSFCRTLGRVCGFFCGFVSGRAAILHIGMR